MKKALFICLFFMFCFFGCFSSKEVTIYKNGKIDKVIKTITNEKAFYDSNATVKSVNNKQKIYALIPQGEGKEPIKLYLPQRDRIQSIPQYKNQMIEPVERVLTKGIVGGVVYGTLKNAFDATQSDQIDINGNNNELRIDKSNSINTEVLHSEEGSNLYKDSLKDSSSESTLTDDHSNSSVDDHSIDDHSVDDHSVELIQQKEIEE